jgi:predicted GNAT family N-acyltransferase
MMHCLIDVARHNRQFEVYLAAQKHAVQFYQKLGFQTEGEDFVEVGIPHIMMRRHL